MLRMNHKSYPADLVHQILPLLYDEISSGQRLGPLQAEFSHSIAALEAALRKWTELQLDFPEQWQQMPDAQAAVLVDASLAQLQKQLAEAGSHPSQQMHVLSYLKDDALGMSELALVNREALWQLQAIMNDCLRRWPTLGQGGSTLEVAVAEWCEACAQLMPDAGGAVNMPAGGH